MRKTMNFDVLEYYFSNCSCWKKFKFNLRMAIFKKPNMRKILKTFRKIESWYLLVVDGKLVFLDENGNQVDGKDIEIKGNFNICRYYKLESLEGCPRKVGGSFDCSICKSLTSLKGAPVEVGGYFDCSYCYSLTSLEGAPEKVGGHFLCACCPGIPENERPNCIIRGKYEKHFF